MVSPSWLVRIRQLLPLLIIVALLGLLAANFGFAARAIGENDFLPRWVAARAWVTTGASPYDPSVSVEAQEMIYGRPANAEDGESLAQLLYPIWAMLFYVPLSIAPYPLALAIWMTILELGLPLLVWMGVRLLRWRVSPRVLIGMMVFAIFSYHGVLAIVTGQLAIITAMLMIGAMLAIQDRRDVLGGVMLALSLVKPHYSIALMLFVILWSISMRRWRLLAVTVVSPVLLLVLATLLSRDWILLWLRSLATFAQAVDIRPPLIIVGASIGAAGFWVGIGLLTAMAVYMVVEWFRTLGKEDQWFQWTSALTLVITCLVTIRTTSANMVLLIPALVLILKIWLDRKKDSGILPALLLGLFVMIGIWALYFITAGQLSESPYLFLPLPMLTLIGLLWFRWWATSGPGFLIDPDLLSWN